MRINYKELAEQYHESGLTKKAFADRMGISSNMVSYYLEKAGDAGIEGNASVFAPIEVKKPTLSRVIKISTSGGLSIEIPI